MNSDFNLAGQKVFKVGVSYNPGRLGTTWVSGFLNYSNGWGAVNTVTGAPLPNDSEVDVTVDLRWSDLDSEKFTVPWLRFALVSSILETTAAISKSEWCSTGIYRCFSNPHKARRWRSAK